MSRFAKSRRTNLTTADLCYLILDLIEDGADPDEIKALCEEHLENLDRFSTPDDVETEELVYQAGLG